MDKYTVRESNTFNISLDKIKTYGRISGNENNEVLIDIMRYSEMYFREHFNISISPVEVIIKSQIGKAINFTVPFFPILKIIEVSNGSNKMPYSDKNLHKNIFTYKAIQGVKATKAIIQCGYKNSSQVPADLTIAFIMHVIHLYDNRTGSSGLVPPGVKELMQKFKKLRF